jgi:zinc protease
MHSKKIFSFILLLFTVSIISAQSIPSGFTKVKEVGGITEYKLDKNDLTILLMEDHSAPVVAFMVTYLVGSRNEVYGTTGATHILEHLMFKGTDKFNRKKGNSIDQLLGNLGAMLNASTWLDRTNYYELLPSEHLELAIEIEADRMKNLWLNEEDRDAEMTVVRNEFEQGENSPFSALDQQIWSTAIQAHPYHHSTIGWKSDIENVPIEKLREFYETFYWPENTTVTVIGDFNPAEALSLIDKYYGEIPNSPNEIPVVYTEEPEQQGQRRLELHRAGQVGLVGVAHKIPEGTHPDIYALSVLNNILSEGKTSRYYKELIDKGMAINAFTWFQPFKDPSLFLPYVFLSPGTKHEDAEKVVFDIYEDIKKNGVTKEEVEKAINQITAETAYGRDGAFSIASQINEAIALGDWTFFATYLDNIKKVTPEDVQNVVKKYMVDEKSTVGWFIPKIEGGNDEAAKDAQSFKSSHDKHFYRDEISADLDVDAQSSSSAKISDNVTRNEVAGIDVITGKTSVEQVVTFKGSFAAGDRFSPAENPVVADLTGNMIDKGTTKHGKFEIAEMLENLGAELSFSVSTNSLDFNGRCLSKDFDKVMELLAEQLRSPAFTQDEFDKLVQQRKGVFKQQLESTSLRAGEKVDDLIFPEGHPNNGATVQEMIDALDKVTLNDVKDFYNKHYGPQSMIFVAVGDVTPSKVEGSVKKYFDGWSGGVDYPETSTAEMLEESTTAIVQMKDKTSATLQISAPTTLKKTSEDYIPFMVGNDVLGHPGGFSGRLMQIVRDQEGLTYGIYSWHTADTFADGKWVIQGAFSPQLLKQGIESTTRELKRWVSEGITQEELDNAKERLSGQFKVQLSTTNGLANQLLAFAERGYDVSYIDEYPSKIKDVTLEQVNNMIKKYIDPDKVVMVIAGTVDDEEVLSMETK